MSDYLKIMNNELEKHYQELLKILDEKGSENLREFLLKYIKYLNRNK